MPDLTVDETLGVLRRGWKAQVDDYAIASGWARSHEVLVVSDAAGGVHGFKGTSGDVLWARRGAHDGGVMAQAIHPKGGAFATAGQDGCVRIWRAGDGELSATIELGAGWVEHLAWSSDGRWLAASISRRVHVFAADGTEVWRSDDHASTVSALAWGARELAAACYGQVSFFEVASGEVAQRLEWKGSLISMVLSPDGDIVVCGSQDNTVHFWRRSTGEDSMMSGYPGKPSALAFDSAGTLLATGGGSTVTIWSFAGDGPEGTTPGMLELHVEPLTTLAFARRGRRLASGARDGSVVVWDVRRDGTGEPVGASLVADTISHVAWRPDGRSLAALDGRGGVTVWRLKG